MTVMQDHRPFFSIITPTYNREKYLADAIASVQAQTFHNYEHIIIDDGSTDGTERLVSSFSEKDPRIRYIKQENKGRSVARNVGIGAAKGGYVCFLDSDDTWNARYIEGLNKAIGKSDSPFLVSRMVWVNEATGERTDRPIEKFGFKELHRTIELEVGMNACVKKELFREDLFDPSLEINEDFELWMRIICSRSLNVQAVPESCYLVTTPEVVGRKTLKMLDSIEHVQQQMQQNPCIRRAVNEAFWQNRLKGIRYSRIRSAKAEEQTGKWVICVLKFIARYPTEKANAALLVELVRSVPGSQNIGSFFSVLKRNER